MKILVLGANGQLGRELVVALSPLGEVVPSTRDGRSATGASVLAIDLEEPDRAVATIGEVRADVIVNAAAYTAVDRAEEEPELARKVNAEAPAAIAGVAARSGSLMVHFSTDYVFGHPPEGTDPQPWKESDVAAPLNVYGETKLAGEQTIRESGCRHLILRTSWLYAEHGRNFARTMLHLAEEQDELTVVDDQTGSPTWVRPLAIATALILARPQEALADSSGTYHLAATGQTTWHEYAGVLLRVARDLDLIAHTPTVTAVSGAEFGTVAVRPRYSVLDCALATETFGVHLPDWRRSLRDCLADLAAQR